MAICRLRHGSVARERPCPEVLRARFGLQGLGGLDCLSMGRGLDELGLVSRGLGRRGWRPGTVERLGRRPHGDRRLRIPEQVDRGPGRADDPGRLVGGCGGLGNGRGRRRESRAGFLQRAMAVPGGRGAECLVERARAGERGATAAGQQVVQRRTELAAADRQGRAAQAASLGVVPAVRAGVLAAGHAELEGLVERVELTAADLALLFRACLGEGFVERRVLAQDVVLEALREDLQLADPALLRDGRLERVARATTLAERLGQDFSHATFTRGTLLGVSRSPSGARV